MQKRLIILFCLAGVLSTVPSRGANARDDLQRGEQLEKAGQTEASIAAYLKAVSADPASAQAYAGLGRGYFRSGKYAEAAASLEKGFQLKPDDLDLLNWLGRCYLQDHRSEKIFELVSRASSPAAHSAKAHLLLARAYEAQEKLKEARQEIHEALTLDPFCRGAHFAEGFIDWSIGDPSGALKELRQEVALDPAGILPSFYLAEVLESRGNVSGAESVIAKMGENNPNAYFYHFSLGKLLERRQSYRAASQSFERAVQADPTQPDAHYHLAILLRRLGETARSDEEFKTFSTLRAEARCPLGQGMGRMRPHLPDFE